MAIRGYKLTHDSGFAPNPFHGVLTLATCMKKIRRARQGGDWVAGFASKDLVQRASANGVEIPFMGIVYLAKVGTSMPLSDYFDDPRFALKKNVARSQNEIERAGDNIYRLDATGHYVQVENPHHGPNLLDDDVGGVNALVCPDFWYLGRKCFVPEGGWVTVLGDQRIDLARLFALPEHFVQSMLLLFRAKGIKPGINADPCLWTTPPEIASSCGPARKAGLGRNDKSCSPK